MSATPTFNEFKAYAKFLLQHHLEALASYHIELSQKKQVPLLKHFAHLSQEELIATSRQAWLDFLTGILEDQAWEVSLQSLYRWQDDQLPDVPKEKVQGADLILIYSIRRQALLKFLPYYTTDISLGITLAEELEEFYSQAEQRALATYVAIQQEQLRQERDRFESLIHATEDGILAFDRNLRVTEWNRAMEDHSGIKKADMLGKRVFDVFPQYEYTEEGKATRQVFTGKSVYLGNRSFSKGGYYEAQVVPLKGKTGDITGGISIIRNITKRKEAEAKQQADAHLIRNIVNTSPTILYIIDTSTLKIIFINQQVEKLLGYTPEQIMELGLDSLSSLIHPEDMAGIQAHFQRIQDVVDGEILQMEYRIRHSNGKWQWFSGYETVFKRNEQGVPMQLIGNALDISAPKQVSAALHQANIHLKESNKELVRTEEQLRELNNELEKRVQQRTTELKEASRQIARLLARERTARAEAETQRQRLYNVFMQSPALICIVKGPQLVYELANPPYLQTVEADGPIEGKTVREVIRHLDDAVWQVLQNVYHTGKRFVGNEFPITADWKQNGKPYTRYYNLIYEPLREVNDKVNGLITFAYEVTEQVMARRTVEASEARIRRILDSLPQIVWTADAQGINSFLNKTWYDYSDSSPGSSVHQNSYLHVHPDDLERTRKKWEHCVATGEPFEIEYRIRQGLTGAYRWLLARAVPLLNEQGNITEWVGTATDIHDQRVAREESAEARKQFQFLADLMPQLVWRTGPQGDYDYFNQRWYDYTGLSYEEIKDKGWWLVVHPDDYQNTLAIWQHSLQTGALYEAEFRCRKADGTYRWFLGRALPLTDAEDRIVKWFGTCTDIHDQKVALEELTRMKQQLENKNEELTRVNVDLDNFVYTASHDLRAPINNLEGLQRVLHKRLKDKVEATDQELMDLMSNSIHKLNITIRDLTEIIKVQKELPQAREPIRFSEVFEDVKTDLTTFIAQTEPQIEVHFEAAEIYYPRKHLRSILLNLLSNAIKYQSNDRALRIVVQTQLRDKRIVLTVTDNGLGIEESKQDKIFNMFKRLHTHVEGSGIGLYMVKRMVENNGGQITVESQKGSGSTFTVYF